MTIYYQCVSCAKTSPDHKLFWTDKEISRPLCPHCWGFVSYAFSVCTADQPEPSIGFCDGCDELEADTRPETEAKDHTDHNTRMIYFEHLIN